MPLTTLRSYIRFYGATFLYKQNKNINLFYHNCSLLENSSFKDYSFSNGSKENLNKTKEHTFNQKKDTANKGDVIEGEYRREDDPK